MHGEGVGLNLDSELEELLSESTDEVIMRERTSYDRVAGAYGDRIVLFGAGGMGRRTLAGLLKIGIRPLAFADNDSALHGTEIDGVPVISPTKAAMIYGGSAVFVVTIWSSLATDRMGQRISQLQKLGCERVVPAGLLFWKYPDIFLPYFPMDLAHKVLPHSEDIKRTLKLWADQESRGEFIGQLRFRLEMNYDHMGASRGADAYFCAGLFEIKPDEVFVDCGAFDGDTIADFVRIRGLDFGEIIAFEPDRVNVLKLEERLRCLPPGVREKTTILPYALGAESGTVLFPATGSDQSRIGESGESIQLVTLDETLRDKQPSFIKFDIEGAEPASILGARGILKNKRPILAVSVYHEQAHLWQIPLLLAENCPNYSFYLRPHGAEGWDLVCYAVPRERCVRSALS